MSRNQPDRSLIYAFGTIAIALMTLDNVAWLLSSEGEVLSARQLRDVASFADGVDRQLLALTRGGLWRVGYNDVWSLVLEYDSLTQFQMFCQ